MNALIYGLEVAVIGMVVVFIGLAILIGIVKVMTVILNKKEEPAPKPAAPVVPTAPAAPAAQAGGQMSMESLAEAEVASSTTVSNRS